MVKPLHSVLHRVTGDAFHNHYCKLNMKVDWPSSGWERKVAYFPFHLWDPSPPFCTPPAHTHANTRHISLLTQSLSFSHLQDCLVLEMLFSATRFREKSFLSQKFWKVYKTVDLFLPDESWIYMILCNHTSPFTLWFYWTLSVTFILKLNQRPGSIFDVVGHPIVYLTEKKSLQEKSRHNVLFQNFFF